MSQKDVFQDHFLNFLLLKSSCLKETPTQLQPRKSVQPPNAVSWNSGQYSSICKPSPLQSSSTSSETGGVEGTMLNILEMRTETIADHLQQVYATSDLVDQVPGEQSSLAQIRYEIYLMSDHHFEVI